MRASRHSWIPVVAASALLSGCEPVHPPPAGYEKNCYGGNYKKTYVKSRTFVTFLVHAPESEWPKLGQLLDGFGRAHRVQVFDTSLIQDNVHLFSISLCDADGLFVYASKQNWQNSKTYDPNPQAVSIRVSAYANHERWRPLAVDLAGHLEKHWEGEVAVSWQPEPGLTPQSAAN
jgi:hypothetical protein